MKGSGSQPSLWDYIRPLAHRDDPGTSLEAAAALVQGGGLSCQLEVVLDALRRYPGSTSAELAERAGLDRPLVARRLPALARSGSGGAGRSLGGRPAGRARLCDLLKEKRLGREPIQRGAPTSPPALSVLAGGADEPAGKRGHAMTARSFLEPFVIARLAPLQTSIGVEPVATVSCVRCFRESGVYLPEILEPEDPIARWGALERARIEAARLFEAAGWRATHLVSVAGRRGRR